MNNLDAMWRALCNSLDRHANLSSLNKSPEGARMVAAAAERFIRRPVPTNQQEMDLRSRQRNVVSDMISGISHVEQLSIIHPRIRSALLNEARKLCDLGLPVTEQEFAHFSQERNDLSTRTMSMCHEDTMRLGRGI